MPCVPAYRRGEGTRKWHRGVNSTPRDAHAGRTAALIALALAVAVMVVLRIVMGPSGRREISSECAESASPDPLPHTTARRMFITDAVRSRQERGH